MTDFDTFHATAMEAPRTRRWVAVGLLLSLTLHAGLVTFFYGHRLDGFGPSDLPTAAMPRVVLKQVTIDPATLDQPDEIRKPTPDRVPNSQKVVIPEDKPQVQDVRVAPQMPTLPKQFLTEKPKVDLSGWNQMSKLDAASRGDLEKGLNSLAGSLLKESPASRKQPRIKIPAGNRVGDGGLGSADGIPGLKSLDEALAQVGPLAAGSIGVSGGALFEYNSYDLRPESLDELQKIGAIIQKNTGATFVIEGHTDSFGDEVYNLKLSEERAESVKMWLVEIMLIAPERIQTVGFGNSQPLVPSDRTKEEQAPNRRVEIVVKPKRRG